jgi:hypothetical protein
MSLADVVLVLTDQNQKDETNKYVKRESLSGKT